MNKGCKHFARCSFCYVIHKQRHAMEWKRTFGFSCSDSELETLCLVDFESYKKRHVVSGTSNDSSTSKGSTDTEFPMMIA